MTTLGHPGMNAVAPLAPAQPARGNRAVRMGRQAASLLGLLVLNLFMVVPAIVYVALLCALYASGIAFYIAGIAFTASGLAGVDEFMINTPFEQIIIESDGGTMHGIHVDDRVSVALRNNGIHIRHENPAPVTAGAAGAVADAPPQVIPQPAGAPAVEHGIDRRTVLHGIGILLGSIALLLLSVLVTRFTWLGLKRYARMHKALLLDA